MSLVIVMFKFGKDSEGRGGEWARSKVFLRGKARIKRDSDWNLDFKRLLKCLCLQDPGIFNKILSGFG